MRRKKCIVAALLLLPLVGTMLPVEANAYNIAKVGQIETISAGGSSSAAIDSNGSLWMWGNNRYGQLGNGGKGTKVVGVNNDILIQQSPVKVLDDVVTVSVGLFHTAAIRKDGTLWIWGYNRYGALGNDGAGNGSCADYSVTWKYQNFQNTPIKILDNVVAVSAGDEYTAAVKCDGSLWMWGHNNCGQLGDGTTEDKKVPVKIMEDVATVTTGRDCTAAIKKDGSLWMWGRNQEGQFGLGTTEDSYQPVKVMDNIIGVCTCGDINGSRGAVIKNDGSLWMWGDNGFGQIGNGTTEMAPLPVRIMEHVAQVSMKSDVTYAIDEAGKLWGWGSNFYGAFGNGTWNWDKFTTPVEIMDDVKQVASGSHTLVLKNDGSVWAWGGNAYGQLGHENATQYSPTKVMSGISLPTTKEYIYDESDPGAAIKLPIDKLSTVIDAATASSAVAAMTTIITEEQKGSATGIDVATLYAETAISKAASKAVSGKEIIINKAAVSDLEAVAAQTSAAVETALVEGGITTARLVSSTVTLTTDETGLITINIDPDILTTEVDKIRVETPTYALTLKVSDLEPDLTEILTITAQDVGSGYAPGNQNTKTTVQVSLPQGKTTNPVTVSLPKDSGDTTYQAVVKTDGTATSSKYNPATATMDGKINTSGSYTVQTHQKDFTDISGKSVEMQNAIQYLASKGIINGTSDTTFSPDGAISRAEIAALLVRALGKLDNSATNSFTDVKSSDWYYSAAGSSQRAGLINGYDDNTFRGTTQITKEQIVAVAARVLTSEMGYKTPGDTSSYLSKYSDGVVNWAQPEVALATKENLVVYRVDGTFKGEGNMTRGDAAIIIYRVFQKIW